MVRSLAELPAKEGKDSLEPCVNRRTTTALIFTAAAKALSIPHSTAVKMASKPTVVFSIGAWLKPDTFDAIRAKLTERRIQSEAPAHPSIGAEPPNKTLADDVASLRSVLTRLIEEEGKDVVLVGHSYGGVVASGAAEGFAKADRKAAGQEGGVALVAYMAAFALDKGQSLLDMLGGQYLPWMEVEVR